MSRTEPTPPANQQPLLAQAVLEGGLPNSDKGIAAIAALAQKAQETTIVPIASYGAGEGIPDVVTAIQDPRQPGLLSVKRLLEEYRTHPDAKRGTARALTLKSFIDLTNRHKTEHSAVFADTAWQAPSFQSVIDYHEIDPETGRADNLKHRIAYAFPTSPEWQAWVAQNGEAMGQGEFAAFLEDRIADLSAPTDAERSWLERDFGTTVATPAQLIQLSRGMQVNVESAVKNIVNLASGEASIAFDEQHTDGDGKPLKVPGIFMLSIAPFFMGEKISLPVRLRYRKKGTGLVWFYQMYRPDQFVTERVRDDLITVADKTELPTFEGSPEAA